MSWKDILLKNTDLVKKLENEASKRGQDLLENLPNAKSKVIIPEATTVVEPVNFQRDLSIPTEKAANIEIPTDFHRIEKPTNLPVGRDVADLNTLPKLTPGDPLVGKSTELPSDYLATISKGKVPVRSEADEVGQLGFDLGTSQKPANLQNASNIEKQVVDGSEQLNLNIEEVLKNGTPEQKRGVLNYLKNNPGKSSLIGTGLVGAGLVGYGLMSGDEPPIPLKTKAQSSLPPDDLDSVKHNESKKETPEAETGTKVVKQAISTSVSKPQETKDETVQEKITETIEPKVLEFGQGSVASLENLKNAQEQANQLKTLGLLGPAFENLGAGISGAISGGTYIPKPTGTEFYKNLGAMGDQVLTDYKAQIEIEKHDPNSSYTKGLKDFIKKTYGYEIKGDISAKDLQDSVMKPLEKQWEQKLLDERTRDLKELQLKQMAESARERAADRALTREQQQMRLQELIASRKDIASQREFSQLYNNITKAGGTAGNTTRQRINSADAIFATVGVDPDITEKEVDKLPMGQLNNLARTLVYELGLETNRMLASGTPAASTLEKLVPKNIMMDVTKLQDYVTNEMNPAEQGAFVKQMIKIASRVKKTSKEQNMKFVKQFIAPTKRLKERDPETYYALTREHGLSDAEVDALHQGESSTHKPKAKMLENNSKTVIKKGYNSKTNQTQFIYSDGSKEIVEGRQ